MTHDEAIQVIRNSSISQFAAQLEVYLLPSIRLRTRRTPLHLLGLGESRFGGAPDWPAGTSWPYVNGIPLAFIAQIHLPDLRRFVDSSDIPTRGWLCCFYEAKGQEAWGFDPKHRNHWRVVHFDEPAERLERAAPPPLPEESEFWPCRLDFEIEYVLPPELILPGIFEPETAETLFDPYSELIGTLNGNGKRPIHRMFGLEAAIQQGDMRYQCQLASNGVYCGDLIPDDDPRVQELDEREDYWELLLQVDTDEDGPGWMWGDCGRIYYWITAADLDQEAYDRAWMILECY